MTEREQPGPERAERVTINLSLHEKEWLRRRAFWNGVSLSGQVRALLLREMAETGYLRPPDSEPEDFGFEKEMMEAVADSARQWDSLERNAFRDR